MVQIGYDSFNLILNLGTLAFLFVVYLLKLVFFVLVVWPLKRLTKSKFFKRLYERMFYQIFFGDLILLFIEGYFEFLISTIMGIRVPEASIDNYPIMKYASYINFFVATVFLPGIYIWLLQKDLK